MVSLITDKVKVFNGVFMVEIPSDYKVPIEVLLKKKSGYIHVMLGIPQKKKSTGPRSEINLIHGSCESIAEQLGYYETKGKAEALEYVKGAMKRMAVGGRGYPTTMNEIDGNEEPMSLAYASSEQAKMVIDTILDFCSINNLWLIRYTEDYPPVPEKYWVQSGETV
jgi:hypothetical protein